MVSFLNPIWLWVKTVLVPFWVRCITHLSPKRVGLGCSLGGNRAFDPWPYQPIPEAAKQNDTYALRWLLRFGADPGKKDGGFSFESSRLWLKIKQEGLRGFLSMFPLTRVSFWYRFFEPQTVLHHPPRCLHGCPHQPSRSAQSHGGKPPKK